MSIKVKKQFDAKLYDKEELLSNSTLLAALASGEIMTGFDTSELAQDLDILSVNSGYIACLLAKHSIDWAKSAAAQQLEVLALAGGDVAALLAHHSDDWWKSPAAYEKQVLNLTESTFTNILAKFQRTNTKSIHDAEIEVLCRFIYAGAFKGLSGNETTWISTEMLHEIVNLLRDEASSLAHPEAKIILEARIAVGIDLLAMLSIVSRDELTAFALEQVEILQNKLRTLSESELAFVDSLPPCNEVELLNKIRLNRIVTLSENPADDNGLELTDNGIKLGLY